MGRKNPVSVFDTASSFFVAISYRKMFETPVRYALPYRNRPSSENVNPLGTPPGKSKVAIGVTCPLSSAAVDSTRTSCLPLMSPKDAETIDPSAETSRSYGTVPYGSVTARVHSVYGGAM